MSDVISVEPQGDVAVVRIDRPPANAMDLELLAAGHDVLARLAADEPGAVVLAGRPGFFSAGLDLKVAPTLDARGQRDMAAAINRLFAGWYGFPRPVVCAVTGHAIAGGLILALCGDHRVGSTEGRLGLTELKAGIPYPAVAMAVVQAELAPPVARRLVLRAQLHDPPEALALGVVDELAAPDAVVPRALEVAYELAALPRFAYGEIKRQLRGPGLAAAERALADADDPATGAGWLSEETAAAAAATLRGEKGANQGAGP
ncbi:MAG TPA: enoyl-CoA hydratase/isomerase family protein [Solirubrobacteraceae bacterium]|nr:enoyl-CoA hydratase/isomerase family protein [Solirubrobacteraceae bacterium]